MNMKKNLALITLATACTLVDRAGVKQVCPLVAGQREPSIAVVDGVAPVGLQGFAGIVAITVKRIADTMHGGIARSAQIACPSCI